MNKIEELLENALSVIEMAKEMNATVPIRPHVLISGLPGSGKTSITKAWAESKGIPLVSYDLSKDLTLIYKEDENGILRKVKAEKPEFDVWCYSGTSGSVGHFRAAQAGGYGRKYQQCHEPDRHPALLLF